MKPFLRKFLKIFGWTLGSLVGLILVLLGSTILLLRSHYGQQKVLAFALPKIQKSLLGKLSIQEFYTDVFHQIRFEKIYLTDAEGNLAVFLDHLEIHYQLQDLLHKKLHITQILSTGGQVHARLIQGGKLNLTTLVKPKDPNEPPIHLPVSIQIDDIQDQNELFYDPVSFSQLSAMKEKSDLEGTSQEEEQRSPGKDEPSPKKEGNLKLDIKTLSADATLSLKGSVFITNEQFDFKKVHMEVTLKKPFRVEVLFQGGLHYQQGNLQIIDHQLRIQTQAQEFQAFVPTLPIQGPLDLLIKASGSLAELHAFFQLSLPKGEIHFQAQLKNLLTTLFWQMTLQAKEIDASALIPTLPRNQIKFLLTGQGQKAQGTIHLQEFLVSALEAEIKAQGQAKFEKEQISQAQAQLSVGVPLLAKFSPFVKIPLSGGIHIGLSAQKKQDHLQGDLTINGEKLHVNTAGIEKLQVIAKLKDFSLLSPQAFSATLQTLIQNAKVGDLHFRQMSLQAQGDQGQAHLFLRGQGPKQTSFRLGLTGYLHTEAGTPQGLSEIPKTSWIHAFIQELQLERLGNRLFLQHPAQVVVSPLKNPTIKIQNLALKMARQELKLDAQYQTKNKDFSGHLDLAHINVYQLVALVQKKPKVPQTDFNLKAHAWGNVKKPYAQLALQGTVKNPTKGPIGDLTVQLQTQISPKQAQGTLSVKSHDPTAQASFQVPLQGKGPLSFHLTAQTKVKPWQDILPPSLKTLQGAISVQADASGSIIEPQIEVNVAIPQLAWNQLQAKKTQLQLKYQPKNFSTTFQTSLWNQAGVNLGQAQISVAAPLEINPKFSSAKLKALLLNLPLQIKGTLQSIQIAKLLSQFQADAPLQQGTLDSQFQMTGTGKEPIVDLAIQAKHLVSPKFKQAPIDIDLRTAYQKDQAILEVSTKVKSQNLLMARAETKISVASLLTQKTPFDWKELPVKATLTLLPYELSQFLPVRGSIKAHADFSGSFKEPEAKLSFLGEKLGAEDFELGTLQLDASYNEKQGAKAQVKAQQQKGALTVDASIPISLQKASMQQITKNLNLRLLAKNYVIAYQAKQESPLFLKVLRGTLNADLKLQGIEKDPTGFVQVQKGAIAFPTDPRIYQDIDLSVSIEPKETGSRLSLKRFHTAAELGSVDASGYVELEKMMPKVVELSAKSKNFPISAGPIGLWLDTEVKVQGKTEADGILKAQVTIPSGKVVLPKLTSTRNLQPLEPIDGVTLITMKNKDQVQKMLSMSDPKEVRKAYEVLHPKPTPENPKGEDTSAKEGTKKEAFRAQIQVKTTSPIYIRGPEVNAELTANTRIEIGESKIPKIVGKASVLQGGRIEFLNKRYDIERAQVSLGGETPPNPTLDVKISRKITDATLSITVTGPIKKPEIHFRSDPPIYDESRIIAILIMGDPKEGGDQNPQLSGQAIGYLSGLILGQFQEEIAKSLGLDTLKVETGGGSTGLEQTRIEAGKYLTNDLYMSYVYRFGAQNDYLRKQNPNEVRLEYRFFRNFRLDTRYGTAGIGEFGFSWSRRF